MANTEATTLATRRDSITNELMEGVEFEQIPADSPLREAIDRIISLEDQVKAGN